VRDSTEAVDPLVGTLVAERYRVEKRLGQGGMGTVYVAEHLGIGKRVALKCLNPEYAANAMVVERFLREARLATAAGNEHIVDVTDIGKLPDGAPFIVMELLEGRELGDALAQDGPFVIGRAVRILRQACDALAAAHDKGIVHRDLKPDNLFLAKRTRDPEFVKVLDFGISKLTESGKVQKLTGTGMTLGTPHYMSPEQAQGLPSVDHRTDVYALGVILYELLVGELPFDEETFPMLVVAIVTRDAPSVRVRRKDVPFELDAVVQRCLAKDPELRPQSVAELGALLEPFEKLEPKPELIAKISERATVRPGSGVEASTQLGKRTPNAARAPNAAAAQTGELVGSEDVTQDALPAPPRSETSTSGMATQPTLPLAPRGTMFVLGLGLALAGAGAIVWIARGSGEPTANDEATSDAGTIASAPIDAGRELEADAVVTAGEGEVRFRILAAPRDAKIFLDDVEFPNPLDVRRARREVPVRLRIEREGYATIEQLVVLDRDVELVHVLEVAPTSSTRTGTPQGTTMASTMASTMAPTTESVSGMETSMETSTTNPPDTMGGTSMDGFRDDF
jgi:serine/threonine-protein kinase